MGTFWIPIDSIWSVQAAGYLPDTWPTWKENTHVNPNLEWILTTGDNLRLLCGDDQITLNKGEFVVLRPNEIHRGWGPVEKDVGFYWVQFITSPRPIFQASSHFPLRDAIASVDVDHLVIPDRGYIRSHKRLLSLTAELVDEWNERPPYYQLKIRSLLEEILTEVARSSTPLRRDSSKSSAVRSTRQTEILDAAVVYLDQTYMEPFSAEDLSRHLNLSYQYICRAFRAGTGMSPTEYIQRRRINKARSLLISDQQRSIAEVARAVGFKCPFYFSRIFKKMEGVAPSVFQQRAYRR